MDEQLKLDIIKTTKDHVDIMFEFLNDCDEEAIHVIQEDIKRDINILKSLGEDTTEIEENYNDEFDVEE